jgi:hypothetical protein
VIRDDAVVRRCYLGHKIGPLFVDDPADANVLLRAIAAPSRGEDIILDVPEPNEAALELAERHDLSQVFDKARMVSGTPPSSRLDATFGIITFELG